MKFYFDFGPHSYRYPRYVCFDVKNSTNINHCIEKIKYSNLHLAYSVTAITDRGPEWVKNRSRSLDRNNLSLTDEELKNLTWQILQSTTINK